jgi:hypothetical protein
VESCADFERREGSVPLRALNSKPMSADELAELREQADMDPSVRRARFDITKLISGTYHTYGDKITPAGDPDASFAARSRSTACLESISSR